ncbi:MAG: Bax inhibitor-1/YccA family protein [Acholeplasmataceae bacterium]
MRSANPVFRTIEKNDTYAVDQAASYQGIIIKTAMLLLIAVASGFLAVTQFADYITPLLITSVIVALISVLVSTFVPKLAMPFGILYALSEGVLLGVITVIFGAAYEGIVTTALLATGSIFTVMLFLYSSRAIRVTSRLRRIMISLLLGFLVFFVIFGILSMYNVTLFDMSGFSLLISGVLIIYGAIMLTLNFDNAERIVDGQADKVYEWVIAIGLMVTIVWIYVELLRFLAIISSRRN